MRTLGTRKGLLVAIGCALLATTACASSGAGDEADPTSDTSASPSAEATSGTDAAPATIDGSFEFDAGAAIGTLAEPWTTTDRADGVLFHQLPDKPGVPVDDAVWGDVIVYVPDAAYGPGATEPEPVPADPVAWTLSHPDLEILDQREVTVDGVTATQIDARAVNETNWLAVESTPFGWGGDERVVLIPLDGAWLVVRGSTFSPEVSFAEDLPPGDALSVLLDSVDLPD
ncbi:hypothetical protein AVP42_00795 [Agromyces sp. NDB4Y10]|uniref:hypothetical protein n=1 Tax=Agromyces sp. NDB4Y10 TaxID=1775951 RepID=UPI0007B213CE|nr:hypothetical protein [Agromyces sp. NDB4Y10]KZE94868.1 hypothetical protein AVP42_00795 [Agromyces sp. NDB4Y10]